MYPPWRWGREIIVVVVIVVVGARGGGGGRKPEWDGVVPTKGMKVCPQVISTIYISTMYRLFICKSYGTLCTFIQCTLYRAGGREKPKVTTFILFGLLVQHAPSMLRVPSSIPAAGLCFF